MIRYQMITFSAFLKVMFEIQISYNIIDMITIMDITGINQKL